MRQELFCYARPQTLLPIIFVSRLMEYSRQVYVRGAYLKKITLDFGGFHQNLRTIYYLFTQLFNTRNKNIICRSPF